MKILLFLVLTGLALSAHGNERDDVNSIALALPVTYDQKSKDTLTSFTDNLTSKATARAADLINADIHKRVNVILANYKKDLGKYYPKPGELDQMIKTVVDDGIRRHLREDINDKNLVQFYKFLGQNLVGRFNDKILEVEGVTDPARRGIWVTKLLTPFNECIDSAKNFKYEASHCIDALASSVTPNAGLGLVYELSNSLLSTSLPETEKSKFNLDQVKAYRACIGQQTIKLNSTSVINCALGAMKGGIGYVTSLALSKTIKEKASSDEKAKSITQTLWPSFKFCTDKVNGSGKGTYAEQFFSCIDTLVIQAGEELVADKILSTPAVRNVMSSVQIQGLAKEKSKDFKDCAIAQKNKGDRKNGILNIDPCEAEITNEVTYKVVSETLRSTAATSLRTDPKKAQQVGSAGIQLLNQCWSNKQSSSAREACLRKTIIGFSGQVAEVKLNLAIPEDMPGKAELNKSSVMDLGKCIGEELPQNISESSDLTKGLDNCTGKLTRSVALKVAAHQIKSTAEDNIEPKAITSLVENLVNKEFANCIGPSPSDDLLERCTIGLTTKASKTISDIAFSKEVNDYMKSAGGIKALGLTQGHVDNFLIDLKKSNAECIDRKPIGDIMDQVNACIKNSVKKIAFFFGDAQFNKSIGNMYAKREEDKKRIQNQFKVSLSECLGQKDAKEFSISDYTKNLYTCSDRISHATTLTVGKDQIESSLNEYLKDRPNLSLKEKRDSIRNLVLGKFNKCMDTEAATSKCIDSLKREATGLIVIDYGRAETKVQLNADIPPEELRPVEDKFSKCISSKLEGEELSTQLDKCTEGFALDFARALGALKLTYLLKQALGTSEYEAQRKNITATLDEYNSCLDGLEKYSMSEGLTEKLAICTDKLTFNGMNLVRRSVSNWMSTEEKDAATVMIKHEFATFLPCLSALLPTSPYTPLLEQNIESSVKPLAVLLSHYIEYNPENAKQTLDGIMMKLVVDLNDVAATKKAKTDLLDFLYENKGLDQFIKAIVRGTIKDALVDIPDSEVPQALREVMLKKEIFEELFDTAEGNGIKSLIMNTILRPALVEGQDMRGGPFKASMDNAKEQVVRLLLHSPKFGEQVIKLGVQKQINDMNGVTKFFAKALYGREALEWDKVRLSKDGQKAEAYIRDNILLPKFKGTPQTAAEKKKINEEAEKLVKKAVKSYG